MNFNCHPARGGRAVLIVLLSILTVGAVLLAWLWSRPATQPSPDAGRGVAETFLRDVREGRADAAWQSTTAEFKSAQGRESFVQEAKGAKYLTTPLDFISTQTVTVQDQPRSEFLFRAADGPEVRVVLGNEGGAWKVDRWARTK